MEILGFKIWYNRNKNEYTDYKKLMIKKKKSFLD